MKRPGHKNVNAVSHNRSRPEVLFLNLTWRSRGQISSILLQLLLFAFSNRKFGRHGKWSVTFWQLGKQHLGPHVVVGYGIKIFWPGLFITSPDHLEEALYILAKTYLPSSIPLFSSAPSGCTLPENPLSPVEWHVHLLSLFSRYSAIPSGSMMSIRSRLSLPLMKLSISLTVSVLWMNRWNAESARICVIRVRLERELTGKLHYSCTWKPTRRDWNTPCLLTINIIFHNNCRNSWVLIG